MNDIETLMRAKSYIDSLAHGINPIDGSEIPENDTVNHIRITRCLFYVSDILEKIIDNGGIEKTEKKSSSGKADFSITYDRLRNFEYSTTPINVTTIVRRINSLKDNDKVKNLKTGDITGFLLEADLLEISQRYDGKQSKVPTEAGLDLGISMEIRSGMDGRIYHCVLYSRKAQEFIIDNMDSIIEFIRTKK